MRNTDFTSTNNRNRAVLEKKKNKMEGKGRGDRVPIVIYKGQIARANQLLIGGTENPVK